MADFPPADASLVWLIAVNAAESFAGIHESPLRPLWDAAADFRRDYSAMESAFDELFSDLDQLRRELDRKDAALTAAEEEAAQERSERERAEGRIARQESRIAALEREIEDLRREAAADAPSTRQLVETLQDLGRLVSESHSVVAGAEDGDGTLGRKIDALQELITSRPSAVGGGDDMTWGIVQTELAELRRQLFDTREALSAEISRSEQTGATAAQLRELEEQLQQSQQERIALETELTLVRSRALELHDVSNLQKQELASERESTARELKELRILVEEQAALLKSHFPAPAPPAAALPPEPPSESTPKSNGDPVMSSVMAQFAKLQKDVAQRRKK